MSNLRTNFKDDVLTEEMNNMRRYSIVQHGDDSISLIDVSSYEQIGDDFGSGQINTTHQVINSIGTDLDIMIEHVAGLGQSINNASLEINALKTRCTNIEARCSAIEEKTKLVEASYEVTGGTYFNFPINYPEGFNKNNCVIKSIMLKKPTGDGWTTGADSLNEYNVSATLSDSIYVGASRVNNAYPVQSGTWYARALLEKI